MTIQEMANKWVEIEVIKDPLLNEPDWEQIKRCMTFALTSLLEELPEVEEQEERSLVTDYRISGENIYREKIKALIQNKLK